MQITKNDVEHVAALARIKIDEIEKEKLSTELSEIIGYVEKLGKAQTEKVEPISQISGLENVAREDLIIPSLSNAEVTKNAPDKDENFIRVKKIF